MREAEGEKNRDRRHGIKDVLFLKSLFLIFTCADFRFMCWSAESSYCAVQEIR